MINVIYVYVDTVLGFYGIVGCLSMIVWTHSGLSVVYACVLYYCIILHLFSAIQHASHG